MTYASHHRFARCGLLLGGFLAALPLNAQEDFRSGLNSEVLRFTTERPLEVVRAELAAQKKAAENPPPVVAVSPSSQASEKQPESPISKDSPDPKNKSPQVEAIDKVRPPTPPKINDSGFGRRKK